MRSVTLILPYYRNAGMLTKQQEVWRDYSADLKSALHVIVVDDGSPKCRAEKYVEPTGIASFRLFRVGVDVRWNWIACRNIGVHEATTDWVLLTDIDHVIPDDTLRRIVTGELSANMVYRFARVDAPHLKPTIGRHGEEKAHPNTWLMTREMYNRVGGYDERFSGWYGTDGDFRDRVHARARAVVLLPEPIVRYPREVIADASTTTYQRKTEEDRVNVARIRDERQQNPKWRPLRLTFPYTEMVTIPAEAMA
jgi:glycosyltransferase involved in cell wall biosynthesis